MHPNPSFRGTPIHRNLALVRERGFGTLAVNQAGGPLLSHVPFVLDDAGIHLDAHLVRSNPIVGPLASPQHAVIAVNGGDGYVSPDWYGLEDQVPTWNYVAVHLRGTLTLRPQDRLRGHLDALSAANEARLAPKPAWTSDKVTPQALDRMMRMIVPVRLTIADVQGTWKLSQNKPGDAPARAGDGLRGSHGLDQQWIADLMTGKAE